MASWKSPRLVPIAGARECHASFASDLEGEGCTGGDREIVGQVADEAEYIPFEIPHMYIAVFTFGRTSAFSEVLGKHFSGREPANEECAHVPVKRGDDIIALKG